MSQHEKVLLKILRGTADKNVGFDELVNLLGQLGFQVRVKGSHHIFYRQDIGELSTCNPPGSKPNPTRSDRFVN